MINQGAASFMKGYFSTGPQIHIYSLDTSELWKVEVISIIYLLEKPVPI